MTRELQNILSSGEVTDQRMDAAYTPTSDDRVVDKKYLDSQLGDKQDKSTLTADIDAHLTSGNVPDIKTYILTAFDTSDLGEATLDSMVLNGSFQIPAASDPSYEGLVLAIGNGGLVTLRDIPEQDIEWTDTNPSDIVLVNGVESADIVAVTPDENVPLGEGTLSFSCKIDNTANQDSLLTLQSFIDGVPAGIGYDSVPRNTSKLVVFLGPLETEILAGQTISVRITSGSGASTVLGSDFVTTLTITKVIDTAAAVAGMGARMNALEALKPRVLTSATPVGPSLTIAEIEATLDGVPLNPGEPAYLVDGTYVFAVVWTGSVYAYERLSIAT